MDNKYGLGSAKVAHEHQDSQARSTIKSAVICRFCGNDHLVHCQTMDDHLCENCGKWQNDISMNYSTGRSTDY